MTDLRKAAEMALELLEIHVEDPRCEVSICKTIATLRQALAQSKQELVAWMYEWNGEKHLTFTDQSFVEKAHPHFNKSIPLYTAPPKHPEQEPVGYVTDSGKSAYFLKGADLDDDTPLYTAPPKREWKGLTSDDKHFLLANAWNKEQAFDGFMEAIDKFLEEKNT